jgi:23S rRNA (guanosine2251-2'-O)-methyltransferase
VTDLRPEEVVAGRRPALEAVRSGLAREVLVAGTARSTSGLRQLQEAARRAGVPISHVPMDRVERAAGNVRHQGVVAVVGALPTRLAEADLAARDWPPEAVVIVLDGVVDPHNVGAVARTSEAAGASALVVRKPRGAGLGPAAIRTSAGALLHLPVAAVANIPRALGRLKEGGFWVVGLDEEAKDDLLEARRPAGRLAVVLGSEGSGMSRLALRACDETLRIPLRGRTGSLNVSVAAGITLFGYAIRPAEGASSRSGRTDSSR